MNRTFDEMIQIFNKNRTYALNDKTECTAYYVMNCNQQDLSDIAQDFVFDYEKDNMMAPSLTIHDRVILLLIVKFGVVNLPDLQQALEDRVKEERQTHTYSLSNVKGLLKIVNEQLVKRGLVIRCKVENFFHELDGKENAFYNEYIFCPTAKGVNLINKSMNSNFSDANAMRIIDDINMRDKLGRMALTHVALFLEKQRWYVLQNHYSRVSKTNVLRFPMLLYRDDLNCEILLQHLYFVRNPKIETEKEFKEKIRTVVSDTCRWLTYYSDFEKNGERARRKVVLVCNNLSDYALYLKILMEEFSNKKWFLYIKHIYATSVGMVDSSECIQDAMYRNKDVEEVNGEYKLVQDEINFEV